MNLHDNISQTSERQREREAERERQMRQREIEMVKIYFDELGLA